MGLLSPLRQRGILWRSETDTGGRWLSRQRDTTAGARGGFRAGARDRLVARRRNAASARVVLDLSPRLGIAIAAVRGAAHLGLAGTVEIVVPLRGGLRSRRDVTRGTLHGSGVRRHDWCLLPLGHQSRYMVDIRRRRRGVWGCRDNRLIYTMLVCCSFQSVPDSRCLKKRAEEANSHRPTFGRNVKGEAHDGALGLRLRRSDSLGR